VCEVKVAVLGDLELRVNGRTVPVTRPRLRAMLCALALRAGRTVPVEELAEHVWQEGVPDRFRPGLHTLVTQLRKLVGADALRTVLGGYLLDVPPDAVDALLFQRLLDSVRDVHTAEARPVLATALGLWRGDLLATQLRPESVTHLVERYLSAVQRRVDIDLELGRHTELSAELQDLTSRFPLREPLWARLMTTQYRSGRYAEALDTYLTVRRLLADSLGTDPSAELRDLYSLVLSADHDMSRVVPHQLPPAHTAFTGRTAELSSLDTLADGSQPGRPPVIVAMHGPAGAGKTALALHWAHRAHSRFPDGSVYIDMHGFGPGEPVAPATALARMLAAVGVSIIPPTVDERTALWRTRLFGRRMVLVIDNVRDAAHLRPLLPGASGVTVLVTSRNDLRGLVARDGAHSVGVGELRLDEAVKLLGQDISTDLAEACGRLPLALMVAAHRMTRSPAASFAAELRAGNPLDLLAEPSDPAVDLRTVLSWSYRTLDEAAAIAFRGLASHPAGEITPATAANLLSEPVTTARRLLDTLAAVHLLEHNDLGGYRFNPLIRQYATEVALDVPSACCCGSDLLDDQWLAVLGLHCRVHRVDQLPLQATGREDTTRVAVTAAGLAPDRHAVHRDPHQALAVERRPAAVEHGYVRNGEEPRHHLGAQ
jgi:DNA-binding SARP family transcriptional activator